MNTRLSRSIIANKSTKRKEINTMNTRQKINELIDTLDLKIGNELNELTNLLELEYEMQINKLMKRLFQLSDQHSKLQDLVNDMHDTFHKVKYY